MISLAILAAVASFQGGWTWTLYEDGPLVLANEIPDTPQLKAVLECDPGSGVARLDLYDRQPGTVGIATIVSGSATATAESEVEPDHRSIPLRTDHPVFGQFVLTGGLDVSVGDRRHAVKVEPVHLAKLRRFAELCGG